MGLRFTFDKDAATVCGLMSDPEFRIQQCLDLGEESATCDLSGDDDAWALDMKRVVVRDGLPSFLTKVFDPRQTMHFVENWHATDDGWAGQQMIKIEGAPVTVTADFQLVDEGAGSVFTIAHKVKVKIPVIGSRVEKFVKSQIEEGLSAEMQYTADAL